jgi:hypothetical protein
MTRLADLLVGLFVRPVRAGACIAIHGCCCGKKGHGINCLGICVKQPNCRHGGICSL